jgi:hypothetical protein
MVIKKIPISKINPALYNPRKDLQPDDADYKRLLKSMDEFDCVEPLVWNRRSDNLVGCHQRFKILKTRGDKHVTLIAAERLDRRCFGIELEPKYCNVISRRFITQFGRDLVSNTIAKRYTTKEVSL